MKKLDGQLTWGAYTNDETGQHKFGVMLQMVGFDTPEEAEKFCEHVAVVANKEFGTDLQKDPELAARQQAEAQAVH